MRLAGLVACEIWRDLNLLSLTAASAPHPIPRTKEKLKLQANNIAFVNTMLFLVHSQAHLLVNLYNTMCPMISNYQGQFQKPINCVSFESTFPWENENAFLGMTVRSRHTYLPLTITSIPADICKGASRTRVVHGNDTVFHILCCPVRWHIRWSS